MVMSSLWQRDSENGNLSGLEMSSEGTGIGAPAPSVAGYLGKCEEKTEPPGDCPWCLAKGQTNSLRYYAINLEENIILCTNPTCLYPLVSRPLEDVRASLSTLKGLEGCKRKASTLPEVEPSSPSKRLREEELENLSAVPEPNDLDLSDGILPNDTVKSEEFTIVESIPEKDTASVDGTEEQCPEELSIDTNMDEGLCDKKDDCVSSTQDETEMIGMDTAMESTTELVPVQPHLFWKNENNLCWLDSLLVVLVNCKTIRETQCQNVRLIDKLTSMPSTDSTVWNLCSTYDKTCAYIEAKRQQCEDNITRVSADVLEEAEQQLSALRLSIFKLLQPTLKCEFGQQETPVFALPLLLRSDKWAQDLFQHTVRWEFKCTSCGYTVNDSVQKTLTTLTQILSNWHPLNAIHRTQCSNCNRKNQRRKMVPERLSSVFALHFVEGLPRKDISRYSFEFQDVHYNVSTVIRYNKNLQHFATWIHQSDGSWLELDDLKYPNGIIHKRFTVPAGEVHIVFWEADSKKEGAPESCPLTAPPAATNADNDKRLHNLSDSPADDTCVITALTVNDEKDSTAASTLDASIGSITLLDTFEGLSHNDIVTLTLVENNADVGGTRLHIPQSQAVVPAVLPKLPLSSSLSNSETIACEPPKTSTGSKEQSALVDSEIALPSVVRSSVATQKHVPSPLASTGSAPVIAPNFSSLLLRHPSFQSTPVRFPASVPKPILKCENSEALPAKPADLFGGFKNKKITNQPNSGVVIQNPGITEPAVSLCSSGKVSDILKSAGKKTPSLSATTQPMSTTDALRLKLMKKLKAKKKKLAKLNQLLGNGESTPKPDSTALSSPHSVTSSTSAYSPAYDQFFAELLSPATTISNLSPDSTGLMEMLNNSQNGETTNTSPQENTFVATVVPEPTLNYPNSTNDSMILDEYMETGMGQTAIENTTDFNGLDLFF